MILTITILAARILGIRILLARILGIRILLSRILAIKILAMKILAVKKLAVKILTIGILPARILAIKILAARILSIRILWNEDSRHKQAGSPGPCIMNPCVMSPYTHNEITKEFHIERPITNTHASRHRNPVQRNRLESHAQSNSICLRSPGSPAANNSKAEISSYPQ
jgi:hypothetical protein